MPVRTKAQERDFSEMKKKKKYGDNYPLKLKKGKRLQAELRMQKMLVARTSRGLQTTRRRLSSVSQIGSAGRLYPVQGRSSGGGR